MGGWGAELNQEIVSCGACVPAACMPSEFGAKMCGRPISLFPVPGGGHREKEKERERDLLSSCSWLCRYCGIVVFP